MTAHTCTKHPAGTPACYYRHACRCTPCRDAGSRQGKRSRVARQSGRPRRVDALAVSRHVHLLLDSGMSRRQIAEVARVSYASVCRLASTDRPRASEATARALLAVHPARPTGWVSTAGLRRRLHALAVVGWSVRAVAEHVGLHEGSLRTTMRATYCRSVTADAIAGAYARLWATPPPGAPQSWGQTRARALRAGYVPGMAWDDGYGPHGIDNPAATPIGMVTAGDLGTRGRTADIIIERIEMGYSMADLQSLGYRETAVERALIRAGRYDMWTRIRPGDVGGTGRNQHTKMA